MWQRVIAGLTVCFFATSSFAATCDFGRMKPWAEGRAPDVGATEYRNLSPVTVVVLNGEAAMELCTFTASPYETLVVPNGFDTAVDHRGMHPQLLPWVNVEGGRSYPVMSQFRLVVHEQQMFSAPPPVSRSIYPSQQQAPTYQSQQVFNDQPTMNVASSCDTSCKVLWGLGILAVGYLVFHNKKDKNNDDDDNNRRGPGGGPVNPAPGLSVQF